MVRGEWKLVFGMTLAVVILIHQMSSPGVLFF